MIRLLFLLVLVVGSQDRLPAQESFIVPSEIGPHHIRVANSSLYLDTIRADYRPMLGVASAQNWLPGKDYAQMINVSAFPSAKEARGLDSMMQEMFAMMQAIDTVNLDVYALTLPAPWSGKLYTATNAKTGEIYTLPLVLSAKDHRILIKFQATEWTTIRDTLLPSFALVAPVEPSLTEDYSLRLPFGDAYVFGEKMLMIGDRWDLADEGSIFVSDLDRYSGMMAERPDSVWQNEFAPLVPNIERFGDENLLVSVVEPDPENYEGFYFVAYRFRAGKGVMVAAKDPISALQQEQLLAGLRNAELKK